MALARRDERLVRLTFGHGTPQAAVKSLGFDSLDVLDNHREFGHLVERLQRFAEGRTGDDFLDVQVEEDHFTPFQRRVVRHCRRIRPGQTLTYGQLARLAGSPQAARAVGNVMANNPWPLVVPCHRVVGAAGSLGGYSARQGLRMKRRLLEMEGALAAG